MVSVVNGYVCFNCTDTEKAQKGVDPANPTNDPLQNKGAQAKRDAARALAKTEIEKQQQTNVAKSRAAGQSGASGQSPPRPAILAPGVGLVLDLTA